MNDINNQLNQRWDVAHNSKSLANLSGCGYDETIGFLKLEGYMKSGINVLEVGVGMGHVTNELHKKGMNVSAVDISSVGLNNVNDVCEKTYLVDSLNELPSDYFDVIICHNVVQHVPTDLLREELKHFIRSLKKDGVFAVEFVSTNGIEDNGANPSFDDSIFGRLTRSTEFLESMVKELGGKPKLVYEKELTGIFQTGVHVSHITK